MTRLPAPKEFLGYDPEPELVRTPDRTLVDRVSHRLRVHTSMLPYGNDKPRGTNGLMRLYVFERLKARVKRPSSACYCWQHCST